MANSKDDESKQALRMYEAEDAAFYEMVSKNREAIANLTMNEWGSSPFRKAEEEHEKKVKAIKSGKVPPPVSYDDGDQSPTDVNSEEAINLIGLMKSVARLENPLDPSCTHLSSWLRCICFGNFEIFMHYLAGKTEDEVKRLVLNRETHGNYGPLHHLVLYFKPDMKDKDYVKIFEKLIILGADVNAKNVTGNTPLHLLMFTSSDVECTGTVEICQMAEKLLKNGADVNLRNRCGITALKAGSIYSTPGTLEFSKLLLVYGADPDALDNEGLSARMVASAALLKLIGTHHDMKKGKAVRQEAHSMAGGHFKQCKVCKSYAGDTKRCSGCYLVWYCSPSCQYEDWDGHKEECKVERKKYVPVTVLTQFRAGTDLLTGKDYSNVGEDGKPSKDHFVVKIQLSNLHRGDDFFVHHAEDSKMLIYNRDKSLYGDIGIEGNETVIADLTTKIKETGFKRYKGYFYAIYKEKERKSASGMEEKKGINSDCEKKTTKKENYKKLEILLNTSCMLPMEEW